MKKLLSSTLALTLVLSAVAPAAHAAPNARITSLIVELDNQNKQIETIKEQISTARHRRNLAAWIGVPTTVIVGLFGLLEGFAGMMSDAPSLGEEAQRNALRTLGVSVAIGGGTGYFIHTKNKQIDVFLQKLNELEAKNLETKEALKNANI